MLQIGYMYVPPRPGGLVCQWRPYRPRSSRTQIQPGGLRDRKVNNEDAPNSDLELENEMEDAECTAKDLNDFYYNIWNNHE